MQRLFRDVLDEPGYQGPFRTYLARSVEFKESTRRWSPEIQSAATEIRNLPLPQLVRLRISKPLRGGCAVLGGFDSLALPP